MTPILYVAAWFLLTSAAFVSIFSGTLDRTGLLIYSFVALGLVFTPLLKSFIAQGRETKT